MNNFQINDLSLTNKPYFHAKFSRGHTETSGNPTCLLGSKIQSTTPGISEGIYAEWAWNNGELRVSNERFGMYPLFYSCYNNEIWISPSIEIVLRGNTPKELDYHALAVFFRMGHFVGSETPFKHIHALPRNSVLVWKEGTLSISSQTESSAARNYCDLNFDEAVDIYGRLFQSAIKRRLPVDENFTVPLSGGRDSRHILLALNKEGVRPSFCPTVEYRPPTTNADARVARLLADELEIDHVVLKTAHDLHEAVLKDIHLTNFCGAGHAWILPVAAYLKGRVNTMYDGLAGSIISGGFLVDETKLSLYENEKFEQLALLILTEGGKEPFNNRVLTKDFARKIPIEAAVSRVSDELKIYADDPNPLQSFVLWNRTRRGISSIPFSILSDIPTVHCPYLDHDLFNFLTSIDTSFSLGNKLHDETIRRAYPNYSAIPYEKEAPACSLRSVDKDYYRRSAQAFWQYLRRSGLKSSSLVRKEFLLPRTLLDVSRRKNKLPWYLMSTVYALELEKCL